ncbi:unnamed protein product [Aphanomyces euteiches]
MAMAELTRNNENESATGPSRKKKKMSSASDDEYGSILNLISNSINERNEREEKQLKLAQERLDLDRQQAQTNEKIFHSILAMISRDK